MSETGPEPVEGPDGVLTKAHNAIDHGITSRLPVIPGVESEELWEGHRGAIVAAFAPADALERALAERVASILWRLHRVVRYEVAVTVPRETRVTPAPADLDKIMRYESRLHRQCLRAIHEIEALQTDRTCVTAHLARRGVSSSLAG